MGNEPQRNSTVVKRPLEWMKFDPVEFMHLIDDMTHTEVGACMKLILKLWQFGPMSEADVRRICRDSFEVVFEQTFEVDGLYTFELVEKARSYGKRQQQQRSNAGIRSAEVRSKRATAVQRPLNERSTNDLSLSLSLSNSKSKSSSSSKKKDAKIEKDETFEKFWIAYERKGNRKSAEQEWQKISPEDHAAIMSNVPKYNASKPDMQFRRDGERYLKHRVWEDAIVIPTNKTATNGQARTQAERDAELDRIVDERYGL